MTHRGQLAVVAFLLLFLSTHYSFGFEYRRTCGLFGCSTNVKSSDSESSFVGGSKSDSSNERGFQIIATGRAANIMAEGVQSTLNQNGNLKPPQKMREIKIFSRQIFLGSFYELVPGSGIYIGNRHMIQGLSNEDFENSFYQQNINSQDFRFYEFQDKENYNETVDAILLINTKTLNESSSIIFEKVRQSLNTQNFENKRWFSWQYGTVNKQITEQFSSGIVQRTSQNKKYFWLDGDRNITAPRSSSSLVWIYNEINEQWKVAGIVECLEKNSNRGYFPRALTIEKLFNQQIDEINPLHIIEEKRISNESCIPIDGRGAGGL